MAPTYKLTYFNPRGLGEPIRFLFHYGGIDFEDILVDHKHWSEGKENAPFGQLPILEYNGKLCCQSISIARYVAKQVGLTGKDDWEDLEIDSVVDTVCDFRIKASKYFMENDEEKKKAFQEEVFNDTIPFYMSRFESLVKKNDGYLAAGKLTWADIYFVSNSTRLTDFDVFEKYPGLLALRKKVLEIPNIKKYVESRGKV